MPQAMMEYLIHEKGFPCGPDKKERTFPKPPDYVPWAEKLAIFKKRRGFRPPNSWVDGQPDDLTWAMLKRYPVAVPALGDEDEVNPRGSGYYGVVRLDLAEHAILYTGLKVKTVIPCKEQLLNRYTNEWVEAWPLDTLTVVPSASASSGMPSIPEGVSARNGLWLNVDDELVERSDMIAEDYREHMDEESEEYSHVS